MIKNENLSSLAVKNSAFGIIAAIISKVGGALFIILIARLLLPKLFGIYSLVISIIIIILTFADFGLNGTVVRYVSKALGKENFGKARAYIRYTLKLKLLLLLILTLGILVFSKFLAYDLYKNPLLFYPLLFSSFYIIIESLRAFFGNLFLAIKNLRPIPPLEFLHQILKMGFAAVAIFFLSDSFKIAGIFIASAMAGAIIVIFMFFLLFKRNKKLFFGKPKKIENTKILNYLKFMSIASISLVFFGSIDTLMLGLFVDSIYLGYYRAALGLILTIAAIFSFSAILLPIFTQINNQRFQRGFEKTFRYAIILTIPSFFGGVILSKYLIFTLYGLEYMPAIYSLYVLSPLIIIAPLVALYSTIFQSKAKVKTLAKSIFWALILNLILNIIFILIFLRISQESAILGAGIATVISRVFLLGCLMIKAKSQMKLNLIKKDIFKPIIASIIMSFFLMLYLQIINLNFILGIIGLIFGILVYFISLWLVKGIGIEDLKLLKSFKKEKVQKINL
jgi:O-antigen/teichoic acid export membrane protein